MSALSWSTSSSILLTPTVGICSRTSGGVSEEPVVKGGREEAGVQLNDDRLVVPLPLPLGAGVPEGAALEPVGDPPLGDPDPAFAEG